MYYSVSRGKYCNISLKNVMAAPKTLPTHVSRNSPNPIIERYVTYAAEGVVK
jgi:hypothetical protein